jgi:arylsulfatase A-like enzyme
MRIQTTTFLSLSLCLVFVPAMTAAAVAAETPERPNLVLILIDDLGYGDIGPFGSKLNHTPNLDRMAAEGMKLSSFYCAPVCTPSRASFMTGCYPKRVSLPNVLFPASAVGISAEEHTLPELLKARGYATMCVGKWHLGDQPEFLPARHGFDHYFGLPYSNDMGGNWDGKPGAEPAPPKRAGGRATSSSGKRPPLPLLRDETVVETVSPEGQDRLTERYTQAAVRLIQKHKDRPFFLYLPHTAVHAPHHPGAAFRGKSKNGIYGDWVEEVDSSVGRVLDTLRTLKLAERTLVFFTSDNGGTKIASNGPLRGYKGSTFEGGMREPTLAWWPGKIPAGSVGDAVAANIDILPTFVELAGGTVPADRKLDGLDIWPLLSGRSKNSPHEAFFYFNGNNLAAVRCGAFKLELSGTLYNLQSDIGETKDVSGKYPAEVKKLRAFLDQMRADLGDRSPGPGCRPAGHVADPQPLLLGGK